MAHKFEIMRCWPSETTTYIQLAETAYTFGWANHKMVQLWLAEDEACYDTTYFIRERGETARLFLREKELKSDCPF